MSAPSEPSALELRGVTRTWRRRATPVLDGVDVSIAGGTLCWLVGANGAGKTTLLRIAAGILAPTAGTVSVAGHSLERQARECKRRMGFLSAGTSGLYARLTVRQQLDLWARVSFVDAGLRGQTIEAAIERFKLERFARQRLDRMSMGERQRVRLAMAFGHGPALVLLDEPRNSLDEAGTALLGEVVAEHRAAGGAVLWCSPTGDRPPAGCDTRLRLADGRIGAA